MARCDPGSAQRAGVNCSEYYRLQAQAADQVRRCQGNLHSLAAAVHQRRAPSRQDRATAARLDKYMGAGTAREYNKIVLVNNILENAALALRNNRDLATFDRDLGSGGHADVGSMVFGNQLNTNTIVHEAVHFGTAPWRSAGGVPLIRDGGIIGSILTYGMLQPSLQRARYGWEYTSKAAASYAWLVTGP